MIKNIKYLTSANLLKFNNIQIKLDSNKTIIIKKSHIKKIFLVIDYVADFTCSKQIIKKNLLPKK